jgi:pseudouridine synthase
MNPAAGKNPAPEPETGPRIRLQKRMADMGLASRRGAEALILEGRVRVNGVLVTELGTRVDPVSDRVELEKSGAERAGPSGIILNKPVGYVTTKGEEEGPTILALLPPEAAGMAYAGRLDKDSRGLVLLLDDGRLNYALTAPETHLEKEYLVRVAEKPSSSQLEKMARGLKLNDGLTRPCRVSAVGERGFRLWITQGRKRQIRRMASKVGMEVTDLMRVSIGPLSLGNLAEGAWRALNATEEKALRDAVARKAA